MESDNNNQQLNPGQIPISNNSKLKSFLSGRKKLPFLLLALVVAIGGGWLVYNSTRSQPEPSPVTIYKSESLNSYKIPGPKAGSGMKFGVPEELTTYSKTNEQVEFLNQYDYQGSLHRLYIAAAVSPMGQALTTHQLNGLNQALMANNTSSKYYSAFVPGITRFITDRMPGWMPQLDRANLFANPAVKIGAWSFTFTVKNTKNEQSRKGKVVYAISGKSQYYFMIITQSYDWQPNQVFWDKVLDSLKIDQ